LAGVEQCTKKKKKDCTELMHIKKSFLHGDPAGRFVDEK
jgi:hypothetical protein